MKKKLISSSKEILGGTAVFAGTRVPIRALIDYLQSGKSLNEFLDDFPSVTRTHAVGVLDMARESFEAHHYERAA